MTEHSESRPNPRHLDRSAAEWRDPRVPPLLLLLLPAAALLAVLPLILHGCSCGHDFDFHLLSWFEAANQIVHGNLHPHWAFTPAWNAGEPRFVFYPPLSWYLGAFLGLVIPWTWTPMVYTWLALTAAGLSCFYLLRDFAPPATALLVAALYIVNPYMLFTAYERTAYAELLCAAWLPLLLHAVLRDQVTIPRIALPVALLWLTNAPAAVLACYGLAILAITRLLLTLRRDGAVWGLVRNTTGGTALGLGLAAFYIVPAAYERRYVESALDRAQSLLVTDNFLFKHTADAAHDAVLHTASLIATALLLATAAALLAAIMRNKQHRPTLIPLSVFAIAIAFLLTSFSTPIWLHAPELAFLQFPWRFLAFLTPALALAIALALTGSHPRRTQTSVIAAVLVAAMTGSSYHLFHQECDDEDTPAARLALFHSPLGTEGTDDYIPNTVDDDDALGHANPPFWLADDPEAQAPANAAPGRLHWPLDLTAPKPQALVLNLRDYPAWGVTLNHRLITARLTRPDGLIAIPISAGPAHLDLTYATGLDQTCGWIISAISLAALLFPLRRKPG